MSNLPSALVEDLQNVVRDAHRQGYSFQDISASMCAQIANVLAKESVSIDEGRIPEVEEQVRSVVDRLLESGVSITNLHTQYLSQAIECIQREALDVSELLPICRLTYNLKRTCTDRTRNSILRNALQVLKQTSSISLKDITKIHVHAHFDQELIGQECQSRITYTIVHPDYTERLTRDVELRKKPQEQ